MKKRGHAAYQRSQLGVHVAEQARRDALDAITTRYGARTANVVAMQLEYPREATDR